VRHDERCTTRQRPIGRRLERPGTRTAGIGRRLVEDRHQRVGEHETGERELLGLGGREPVPACTDDGGEPVRQRTRPTEGPDPLRDRDPADRHAAHRLLSDAGDERCQGRLARAARTDQRHPLAGLHCQVDLAEDVPARDVGVPDRVDHDGAVGGGFRVGGGLCQCGDAGIGPIASGLVLDDLARHAP
jgi:hypothetical protein